MNCSFKETYFHFFYDPPSGLFFRPKLTFQRVRNLIPKLPTNIYIIGLYH